MALLSKDREAEQGASKAEAGSDLSVILKNVRIVGDIETEGRVRLEGTVTGNVRARALELASGGSIEGDAVALGGEGARETFVIDGKVQGAVRAAQVEVGQSGSVEGGIEAQQAGVRGRVLGGIQARHRLALKATAVVEGDIDARRLSLEEGGQVNGNIRIGDRASLKSVPGQDAEPAAKPPARATA